MFNHISTKKLPTLTAHEMDGERFYRSPSGKWLPSVTTILSHFTAPFIEKWRKNIGEKEADNITRIAAERGNLIHELAEKYLKNEPPNMMRLRPDHKQLFISLRKHLDNIDNIQYLEAQLYSEQLGIAGRTDCIAEYKSIPSIIDFKTARKDKNIEWISHYFEQGTAYSLMYEERTGIVIENIVIIIVNDNQYSDLSGQVFSINRSEYIMSLQEKITKYHREKGTHYEQRLNQNLYNAGIDGISISESNVSAG